MKRLFEQMKLDFLILTCLPLFAWQTPPPHDRIEAVAGEIEVVRHKVWPLSRRDDGARVGVIGPGHFATAVVRDAAQTGATELLLDLDGDGTMDGPPRELPHVGEASYATVENSVTGGPAEDRRIVDLIARVRFDPGSPPDRPAALVEDWLLRREGRLRIGRRDIAFRLDGYRGLFGRGPVCLDLDGSEEFTKQECFSHTQRSIEVDGRGFTLEVAESGDLLALEPLDHALENPVLGSGSVAPDFQFRDLNGNPGSLSEYRDRFVLLDFWGTWCEPCVDDLPKLRQLDERFGDRLAVLGLNVGDDPDDLRRFVEAHRLSWRQIPDPTDGGAPRLYRVEQFPTYFLIAPDGTIAAIPDRSELTALIERAMTRSTPQRHSPSRSSSRM